MKEDLERLTHYLRQQRTDLEQLMDDSTVSRRNTDELAEQISRLRKRMEASPSAPGEAPEKKA